MAFQTKMFMVLACGVALGASVMYVTLSGSSSHFNDANLNNDKKPLYWVAPMDANYRRDKPGKSPMGMDLVPVYEDNTSVNESAGVVTIAPHVINNLGVRTAPVELTKMHTEISTVGFVQFDEDKLVHIHPRVSGWIEKLFVKAAGDPVKKGQPLYLLYSPQLVNAQEEFLIALKRDNSTLISAARARLAALQLSNQFIQTLEKNRTVKQHITFFAPQAGVIDDLRIREGFFVQPGTTMMSIGQLDKVWVEAEVFARDADVVKAGLSVTMNLDYFPAKEWSGAVDYVYPSLNDKTRTLRIRLKFDNPNQQLKPNMFAQVLINANAIDKALVVPKEAVIRTGKQNRVVLSLGQGQFKSVEVQIGRVNSTHIEILDGLKESDMVVTSAQFLIDSESSKTADFNRMNQVEVANSVWMKGSINQVTGEKRTLNISHEPVVEWQWPEMTMDFLVDDKLDIESLAAGQILHFEVVKNTKKEYKITTIHIMKATSNEQVPTATVSGVVNSIDNNQRIVNISRSAIEKWQRPAATMDFFVTDQVDLSVITVGQTIQFTFEVRDDLYIISILPEKNSFNQKQSQVNKQAMTVHTGH